MLGYTEKSEELLRKHFEKHTTKTLLIAKVSHGFGIPVQISAGAARINFFKYFSTELLATMPKTLMCGAVPSLPRDDSRNIVRNKRSKTAHNTLIFTNK